MVCRTMMPIELLLLERQEPDFPSLVLSERPPQVVSLVVRRRQVPVRRQRPVVRLVVLPVVPRTEVLR